MEKETRNLIALWIIVVIVVMGVWTFISSSVNAEAQPVGQCPDGSYFIGDGPDGVANCHLNATGCPYGDSIPMDQCVDKSAPVPTTTVTTPSPADVITTPEMGMKVLK